MNNKLNIEDTVKFSGTFSFGDMTDEFNLGASMSFVEIGKEAGRAMAEKLMSKVEWPSEQEMIATIESKMRKIIDQEIELQLRRITRKKLESLTMEQLVELSPRMV